MPPVQRQRRTRGQVIVIFALSLPLLLLMSGLVIDGGYAFAQRRVAQNTADLSALAAARILAAFVTGDTADGTDANVRLSIDRTVAANHGVPVTYGAPNGPQYVDMNGSVLGYVGGGTIPLDSVGIRVSTSKSWTPFFLNLVGISRWSAGATAIARGGYRAGGPPAGGLLPIGVSQATYDAAATSNQICAMGTPEDQCSVLQLTSGLQNVAGGFGWLSFGCGNLRDINGNYFGLGQNSDGCGQNAEFLLSEWGNPTTDPPTPPNGYGCCGEVGLPHSGDEIASLTGNISSVDDSSPGISYYETNDIIGFVPIWDAGYLQGSNAYYHIVGYAGFQITHIDGSKNVYGILRQVIFPGPVTTTSPGFAGAPLAIQLIR